MTNQPETLRDLRRAYARGEIDAVTYRAVRRALVTAVVSGALPPSIPQTLVVTAAPTAPEADLPIHLKTQIMPGPPSSARTPAAAVAAPKRLQWLVLGTGALVVIGTLIYWWPKSNEPTVSDHASAISALPQSANASAQNVLTQFVHDQDWSPTRTAAAGIALSALQATSGLAESDRRVLQRLHETVATRVEQQATLSDLGQPDDTGNTDLITLATALDIAIDKLALRVSAPTVQAGRAELPTSTSIVPPTTPDHSVGAAPASPLESIAPVAAVDKALKSETPKDKISASKLEPVAEKAEVPLAIPEHSIAEVATKPIVDTNSTAPKALTHTTSPTKLIAAVPTAVRAPAPPPKQITLTEAGTPATPPAPLNINKRGCDALIGISLGTQRARVCRDQLADQSDGPTMAGIPGGAFEMGGDRADEQPKHLVQIRYSLGVARFETSVGEFRRFCDATGTPMPPDTPADPKLPIANVSWDEANKYSAWLSQQTGAHYRLPSEAEWEFFARAGVTSRWPDGENNFNLASIVSSERVERTAPDPVAHGASNRFNLVHILGNVAEWVEDAWRENYNGASTDGIPILGDSRKVTRGGSFKDKKERITLSARVAQEQSYRATTIGFRLVRDLQ